MSLTKAEVRAAFREAAARSYAHVPSAEEIDHVFSESFYRRMDALIEEERRGSWRLMSRQRRRTLVVAAILAVSLLLVACTPPLRNAVSDFIVSIYEQFADYGATTKGREEIETIYALNPVPEGFIFVSQTTRGSHSVRTTYQDSQGTLLIFAQTAFTTFEGTTDNEQGEVLTIVEKDLSVLVYSTETLTTASWIYDSYYMKLSYYGKLNNTEIESLIMAISPIE